MTDAAWETLSNQAVAACGVVYFLALLAHLVEWSSLRNVSATPARAAAPSTTAAAGSDDAGGVAVATGGPTQPDEDTARRTALFGRLGLMLTGIAVAVHFVGLVGRGMAADPNRVPWGNMYEFTLSGTLRNDAHSTRCASSARK